MSIYETRLVRREDVAEGTMAFYFERPAGFQYRAGQSLTMTLIEPAETDSEGDSRTFTIASAPHESHLMVATRMRDTAFKRVLRSAPLGIAVRIDGPDGVMVLHDDPQQPAVFLAGGIGITPFLSMVRDAAKRELPHRLYLFYSNRRPEDAAFLQELTRLEQVNASYRLIATMTELAKSSRPWSGETGFFRTEMLRRYIPEAPDAMYYFAGPPAMTLTMRTLLQVMGVPATSMHSEEFYGY